MSDNFLEELKNFLTDANLASYEINAFITLLGFSKLKSPTARELSIDSDVPRARIYDILDNLNAKGLIEIIESRPKRFRVIPLNKALENLIYYQENESKSKIKYLYDNAKNLEYKLYQKDNLVIREPTKLFWSTVFGSKSILSLYIKFLNEAKEEILSHAFVNKNTIKIIPRAKMYFDPMKDAVKRGILVKILWCFQYDDRTITKEEELNNLNIFKKIVQIFEEIYGLSRNLPNFEIKYILKRIPTLYDIIDKKRVLLKFENPLKTSQIFTCINTLDPKLADEFRNQYLRIWTLEALDDINSDK